jgi:hypothetical protein
MGTSGGALYVAIICKSAHDVYLDITCTSSGLCAILCFGGGSKKFTMARGWRELYLSWVIRLVCTGGMEGIAIRGDDEVPTSAHEAYYWGVIWSCVYHNLF